MKRIALTCKDSGKWFHDCIDCEHYDTCDYFQKNKSREIKDEKKELHKQTNP